MRHFVPLVLLLALVGCKPEEPAPSTEPTPRAMGPATLAMLLDEAEGLRLVRHDPDQAVEKREETLAKLPAVHGGADVAFVPGRDEAIVWRGQGYDDPPTPEGLWHVTWGAAPKVEVLKGPGMGKLNDVGYDAQGRPTALVLDEPEPYVEPKKDAKGEFRMFEGKRYDFEAGAEGLKVLAHAYTWEGGAWKRSETIQTTSGWDYGMGVKALKAYTGLAPRTNEMLDGHPPLVEITDPKRLSALKKLSPRDVEGEGDAWQTLPGDPPLHIFTVSAEFVMLSSRIAVDVNGEPQALGGLEAPAEAEESMMMGKGQRAITLERRGPLLLVADIGNGRHPRLVDLATRDMRFSSDRASAAVFWPAATAPVPVPAASAAASAAP